LGLRGRLECFDCCFMLLASRVQHARRHVQKHGRGGVDVGLVELPGSTKAALCLVEVAHPDGHAGEGAERWRDYRPIAPPVALRQGYSLMAQLSSGGARNPL
jgi:hypothetical protein